ncbi:MAG: NUDIX domain-containing protein, partial [Pseudolabrys sp.]|nr:NUDIX domain-containing protein [Pseudolabrys sp.]
MSSRPDLGPKPRLGYAQSALDRAADRRLKPDDIAALAARPDAGAYIVGGEMIVAKAGSPAQPMFTLAEAKALGAPTETVFLGLLDGAARFGVGIAPAAAEALKSRNDLLVTDLRSIAVQGLVEADHLPPIAEAKAMLHWHARHRHCSNCGTPTNLTDCGWKRACPNCKAEHFPRTDPVVIMLTVNGDNCVLGRSPRFVPTMWSCLAGFIEPGESFEDAVRRETREEAGIDCGRVKYF